MKRTVFAVFQTVDKPTHRKNHRNRHRKSRFFYGLMLEMCLTKKLLCTIIYEL